MNNQLAIETIEAPKQEAFRTFHGRRFNLNNPDECEISVRDIAMPMARQPVNLGHMQDPITYSKAARAIWVSKYVEAQTGNKEWALLALMQDAWTAYLGELNSAINLPEALAMQFDECRLDIQRLIASQLNLPAMTPDALDAIETATDQAKLTEIENLKVGFYPEVEGKKTDELSRQLEWNGEQCYPLITEFAFIYRFEELSSSKVAL